jgi:hypothetical protein
MHKFVFMSLLAVVSNHAVADLEQIGGYGETTIYTDPATIHREGNIVKMWNVYNYHSEKLGPKGSMYLSMDQQEEFDCVEKKMRVLYFSYRSGNLGEGDPVYSKSYTEDLRWDPIEPDSRGEYLLKLACGKK